MTYDVIELVTTTAKFGQEALQCLDWNHICESTFGRSNEEMCVFLKEYTKFLKWDVLSGNKTLHAVVCQHYNDFPWNTEVLVSTMSKTELETLGIDAIKYMQNNPQFNWSISIFEWIPWTTDFLDWYIETYNTIPCHTELAKNPHTTLEKIEYIFNKYKARKFNNGYVMEDISLYPFATDKLLVKYPVPYTTKNGVLNLLANNNVSADTTYRYIRQYCNDYECPINKPWLCEAFQNSTKFTFEFALDHHHSIWPLRKMYERHIAAQKNDGTNEQNLSTVIIDQNKTLIGMEDADGNSQRFNLRIQVDKEKVVSSIDIDMADVVVM